MNIDKYGETNILEKDFTGIDAHTYKKLTIYTKFIGELPKDAKVLEIGSGNGSFLYFIETYYRLNAKNLSTLDISKSVIESLSKNLITKRYNNNLSDTIDYLEKDTQKYDLIIMRHVLEHMEKSYIIELIPLLTNSLTSTWKILIEVPNLVNIPLGISLYFGDFSHYTGFTEKSLKEAFLWHSDNKINIKFYNLYLHILNYRNPIVFVKTFIAKYLYKFYVFLLLKFYQFACLPFKIGTTSLIAVITKE